MDNNNMDNFFRQHSHTMDEAPGEALWQRIEGKLPPINTSISSSKLSIGGSKLLLILMVSATVIVAGIVFMRNNDRKVLQPTVIIPTNTVVTETAIEQDTVKKKKQVSKVATETQSIPFRPTKKPINKQQEITDLSTSAPEKTTVTTQPLPEPKVIKTTVVYNPKRTIVTVTEKVNQDVFDSITKANIEKYKNHGGMQLIVKEPRSGHIFRTKFEPQMVAYMLIGTDTIKSINALNQEVITFKTDTLKTIAPAGVMPRYYEKRIDKGKTPEKQKKQR